MEDQENQLDFVSIGDITIDAFIQLKDVVIEQPDQHNHNNEMVCMRFGDKIEYEDVTVIPAVGNSPNAAVSASRLGLKTGLITNIGDDDFGKQDLEQLKKEGISTEYVRIEPGKKSNYHYVLLYKAERTILIKHWEYEYALPQFGTPPRWMYLSSLGENSLPFHHEIVAYLREHPETKLAFQPGTFQMKLGYEQLKDIYEQTEVFFCNREESQRILGTEETDIKNLLRMMHERGPKIVVITDGPDGAYAFDGADTMWQMPMYPDPAPPLDRTGAGDSFSSAFTASLALGNDIPTALSWAPINSMSVVQKIGAQAGLLTREQLEQYLQNRPEHYVPQRI